MATKISEQEKKRAAKEFAAFWKDKGYEKGESQKFWIELLSKVYGVYDATRYIEFEDQVKMDSTSFIDGYISETKVLIEQKSINKDLLKPIRQSNGEYLTPFQQAKNYSANLPYSRRPRWIVTCNFKEFYIYDMENPNAEPEKLLLKDLPKEHYRLNFLVDTKNEFVKKETKISIAAGDIVGYLYDEIKKQYIDPDAPESLRSLNILCVRLVFCLYAEDADVFNRLLFHDFIKGHNSTHLNRALEELFEVLNTPEDERSPYLPEDLKAFPYVNGGLFKDKDNKKIIIPHFTEELKQYLIQEASEGFDWSEISPTIFGAVFESTLNPVTRHEGGMHYTSIENIHKVIDPLFLNDLRDELEEIKCLKQNNVKKNRLEEYRDKLSGLKFLDPACGSGNFLTETYISLRTLENEALKIIHDTGIAISLSDDPNDNIKVKINQFYGIEINDFAVSVAKTALWIAENQMMKRTEEIVQVQLNYLPLTTNAYIVEDNALRLDWNEVVDKNELNYIMGNPPFVGARKMSRAQKDDLIYVFGKTKNIGNLDYVGGWYKKVAEFTDGTNIISALVSTNSITQGEQPAILFKPLFEKGISIDYCHRTFRWDSEASIKAHVHCVIVGFSYVNISEKYIYESDRLSKVNNINAYLIGSDNVFVENRTTPLSNNVSPLLTGSQRIDDDAYVFTKEEKESFIKEAPYSEPYFYRWFGAKEFINNIERWCLYLGKCTPSELRNMPKCMDLVQHVREFRMSSKREQTLKAANYPHKFGLEVIPDTNYMIVPVVSSERRRYIPIGFMTPDVLCSNQVNLIPNATLYHFGILTSIVHMAWMRVVCGRLKSDYRYSKGIVYNNFPWCNPTDEQKEKIEKTAQAILDARALYPDRSLADLYDELFMPSELRRAHQENDRAVMQAYGFSLKMTESECVAELMKMYSKLTENK